MKKILFTLVAAASLMGAASSAQADSFRLSFNTYAPPPPPQYVVTNYWRGTGHFVPQPVYVSHAPRTYVVYRDYDRRHHRHRDRDGWRHRYPPHRGW